MFSYTTCPSIITATLNTLNDAIWYHMKGHHWILISHWHKTHYQEGSKNTAANCICPVSCHNNAPVGGSLSIQLKFHNLHLESPSLPVEPVYLSDHSHIWNYHYQQVDITISKTRHCKYYTLKFAVQWKLVHH